MYVLTREMQKIFEQGNSYITSAEADDKHIKFLCFHMAH